MKSKINKKSKRINLPIKIIITRAAEYNTVHVFNESEDMARVFRLPLHSPALPATTRTKASRYCERFLVTHAIIDRLVKNGSLW